MAEDAWNSRDPERVALAYTEDSRWRNRSEFFQGRAAIVAFLTRKWSREHEYRLIKDLWAFDSNRIAVRFQYEWHDDSGQWHRSYGNEQWEFDEHGLMRRREASVNDVAIAEADRRFRWAAPGPRPADIPGLGETPFCLCVSSTSASSPRTRERGDPSVSASALIAAPRTFDSSAARNAFLKLQTPGVVGPRFRGDDSWRGDV